MPRRRSKRLLIAGVVGAALATTWLALSPTAPPVRADAPAEPVSPLGLKPPPAPVAAPLGAATRAVLPAPVASGAVLRRIGAEGYGPHIERAQAGTDPQAAWEAVLWLRQCASNEGRRHSFEALRNQGVSPEMMTQLMVEADAEARRCQTVTPAHRALLPELASRAMRARLPEAASAYAGAVFAGDLTPAQRLEVAQAMRRDAQAGDLPSLLGALTAHEAWGLSDEERLTYLVAYAALGGPPAQSMAKTLVDNGQIRFRTTPTPEQLEAALRSARPWLEPLRARAGG